MVPRGYAGPAADLLALAYYRHAWAVQDIGGYGAQVFLGDESRAPAALARLRSFFEPGAIVELARAST